MYLEKYLKYKFLYLNKKNNMTGGFYPFKEKEKQYIRIGISNIYRYEEYYFNYYYYLIIYDDESKLFFFINAIVLPKDVELSVFNNEILKIFISNKYDSIYYYNTDTRIGYPYNNIMIEIYKLNIFDYDIITEFKNYENLRKKYNEYDNTIFFSDHSILKFEYTNSNSYNKPINTWNMSCQYDFMFILKSILIRCNNTVSAITIKTGTIYDYTKDLPKVGCDANNNIYQYIINILKIIIYTFKIEFSTLSLITDITYKIFNNIMIDISEFEELIKKISELKRNSPIFKFFYKNISDYVNPYIIKYVIHLQLSFLMYILYRDVQTHVPSTVTSAKPKLFEPASRVVKDAKTPDLLPATSSTGLSAELAKTAEPAEQHFDRTTILSGGVLPDDYIFIITLQECRNEFFLLLKKYIETYNKVNIFKIIINYKQYESCAKNCYFINLLFTKNTEYTMTETKHLDKNIGVNADDKSDFRNLSSNISNNIYLINLHKNNKPYKSDLILFGNFYINRIDYNYKYIIITGDTNLNKTRSSRIKDYFDSLNFKYNDNETEKIINYTLKESEKYKTDVICIYERNDI